MKAFIHIKSNSGWNNISRDIKTLPCKGDVISLDVPGPLCEVLGVMHLAFDAEYDVELYVKEISMSDYIKGL